LHIPLALVFELHILHSLIIKPIIMDKLTVISGCLFFLADVFAIASLANPEWIVTENASMKLGLTKMCQKIGNRNSQCTYPDLSAEWTCTLVFIVLGICCLTSTCVLLISSHWHRRVTQHARWIAFVGMVLFCLAALVFPIGFYVDEIGGRPYKLPASTQVGSSYVLFVMSIFFTIISELFAGKVCLPVF